MQQYNLGKLVGSTNFREVPTGPQVVKCESAEAAVTKTGKPVVMLTLRIQGGEFDGRSVRDQIVLSLDNPDALGFFVGKLAAFGCDSRELLDQCNNTLDPIALAIVDRAANVTLFSDTYNGVARSKVKSYDSPAYLDEASEGEVLPDDEDPDF